MNKKLILILVTLVLSFNIFAKSLEQIEISADKAIIDKITGITYYSGNVIFTQGEITLKADDIHIIYDNKDDKNNKKHYQIVAKKIKQQVIFTKGGGFSIFAAADKLIYFTKQGFIKLIGGASFIQNDNYFTSLKSC